MSSVKAQNHQVGASATVGYNFSWQIPNTPDGTLALWRGGFGSTTTKLLDWTLANTLNINTNVVLPATGANAASLILSSDLGASGGTNIIEGHTLGSRRWTMQLGSGLGNTDFVIANWNPANIGIPISIAWATGLVSFGGSTAAAGSMTVQGSFQHNGATGAWGLLAVTGSYAVGGAYRYVNVLNPGNGHGDAAYLQAFHQPGVDSFLRFSVGGSGNYFQMNNAGQGSSQAGWVTISDARTKDSVRPLEDVDAAFKAVDIIRYKRKADLLSMVGPTRPQDRKDYIGVTAQQLRPHFPELVADTVDGDLQPLLAVHYEGMAPILWAQVQRLMARVEQLEKDLADVRTASQRIG